jgi:hypothetical protein
MRHNPGYGIMDMFVCENRVISVGRDKLLQVRHLDIIACGRVECAVAAVPHDRADIVKKTLGGIDPLRLGRIARVISVGIKAVNLRRVEDGIAAGD